MNDALSSMQMAVAAIRWVRRMFPAPSGSPARMLAETRAITTSTSKRDAGNNGGIVAISMISRHKPSPEGRSH